MTTLDELATRVDTKARNRLVSRIDASGAQLLELVRIAEQAGAAPVMLAAGPYTPAQLARRLRDALIAALEPSYQAAELARLVERADRLEAPTPTPPAPPPTLPPHRPDNSQL